MTRKADPTSVFETLEKLKGYTEFESVRVSPNGTVSVKYAGKQPSAPKRQKEQKPAPTAIDSLKETPPPFAFTNRSDEN